MKSKNLTYLILGFIFLLLVLSFLFEGKLKDMNPELAFLTPNWVHWFGTDSLGRDLFAKSLVGFRNSLFIAFLSLLISLLLGLFFGFMSATGRPLQRRLFGRFILFFQALPDFFIITFILFYLNKYFNESDYSKHFHFVFVVGFFSWVGISQFVRLQVLNENEKSYIEGARAIGRSPFGILYQHLWPQISKDVLLYTFSKVPYFLLYESTFSFLGFGIQSPNYTLGVLFQEGWRSIAIYPHLVFFPMLYVFVVSYLVNFYVLNVKSKK